MMPTNSPNDLRRAAQDEHALCCGGHAESEGDDRPCARTTAAIDALADRLEAITKERDMALAAMSADKADVTLACAVAEHERDDLKRRLETSDVTIKTLLSERGGFAERIIQAERRLEEAEQSRVKEYFCVYCKLTFPNDSGLPLLMNHVRTCDKHPLKLANERAEKAEQDRERMRKVLANIGAGCSFPEDDVQRTIRDRVRAALREGEK